MKRYLIGLASLTLALTATGIAQAHPDLDGSEGDSIVADRHQHGGPGEHLPPTQHNVDLVSKLDLTTPTQDGIADVGYFKGFAYLNARDSDPADCPTAGGVHVVDVRDPSNPVKVGFLQANPGEFPGEGIHVMEVHTPHFDGDILLHNNEACTSATPTVLGMSIWDVTDPLNPVIVAERGLEDWPAAQAPLANGDSVFFHDVQFKRIRGHDFLATSYWDAGQILLNVDDPANPVFVGDSDYLTPDPLTGFPTSEGNSHESYWSSNSKFLISTDEDFAPFRMVFEITTGANAGTFGAGEFGWTPPVANEPGGMINGPTVFGGRGCFAAGPNAGPDAAGDPQPPAASEIPAGPGEEKTVVFSRGGCFFSTKVAAGQDLGYDAVIIGQSHGGTRNGILVDGFSCGGQGHDYDEQIPAICTGHRAMHLLFNDEPEYTGPEGTDIPLGTQGERYQASGECDGWGYVNLHDATKPNLPIIDSYAIPEALDEDFATGFGTLSVHEVKTDPREENLAYFSYYAGGFRVARFNKKGITEVGRFIDQGGNNFWGVFPIGDETVGHGYSPPISGPNPLVLLSDIDFGLYIFRYTGS